VAQREGEDGPEAGLEGVSPEQGEPLLTREVRYQHRLPRLMGGDTRSFSQFGLELLEDQGCVVGGSDVTGIEFVKDQRHSRSGDGHDLNDARHQMIEDPLDGEICHHRASGPRP
jgi:hypothetical protein